jgi:hypothetical protein
MTMRRVLFAQALAVVIIAGCANEVTFERRSLDDAQSRSELQRLGISVPNNYTFKSMVKAPPPGTGGASFDGVFISPSPATPIRVDSTALQMIPTTCQELRRTDLPDGLQCSALTDLRQGAVPLTKTADSLSVVSGQLPSGESHVYLSVLGH